MLAQRTTAVDSIPEHPLHEPTATRSRPREHLLRASGVVSRASRPLLRGSLGVIFIWFGALKLTDSTPIADLVTGTVPFLPGRWFVPALGGFELLLGLALLIGRRIGIVVALMVAHLAGTFMVLVTQPEVVFQRDNPLLLTMTGEFVVKNVVLIAAGIVLASPYLERARTGDRPD
jgi:putative oxidoreductase